MLQQLEKKSNQKRYTEIEKLLYSNQNYYQDKGYLPASKIGTNSSGG